MHRIYNTDKKYILLALYDAVERLGYETACCNSGSGYLDIGVASIILTQQSEGIDVFVASTELNGDSVLALLDEVSAILRD